MAVAVSMRASFSLVMGFSVDELDNIFRATMPSFTALPCFMFVFDLISGRLS